MLDMSTAQSRIKEARRKGAQWACLAPVHGWVIDVYALGLTCPVREFALRIDAKCDEENEMLKSILQSAPGCTDLTLYIGEDIEEDEDNMFDQKQLTAYPKIWRQLFVMAKDRLNIYFSVPHEPLEESGCEHLEELAIVVVFPCWVHDCLHRAVVDSTRAHTCPVAAACCEYDSSNEASKYFEMFPKLQRLHLLVSHQDELITHYTYEPTKRTLVAGRCHTLGHRH